MTGKLLIYLKDLIPHTDSIISCRKFWDLDILKKHICYIYAGIFC